MKVVYLYEDNAGGLHMTDHGKLNVLLGTLSDGRQSGSLITDITGFYKWGYDYDFGYDATVSASATTDYDSSELVAKWDGVDLIVHVARMGGSCKLYGGVEF